MKRLDFEKVKASDFTGVEHIRTLQAVVYVMCGGGFLGKMAIEQPADFYIDSRVRRLPYGKTDITQAVKCLVAFAEKEGLNPHNLPTISFYNCGIF